MSASGNAIRTVVGMSGGVDSSVAALRLRDAGEPLAGLFMQNWTDDGNGDAQGRASVAEGRTPRATDAQGRASVAEGRTPRATDAQGRASVAEGRTPRATEAQGRASVAEGRTPRATDAQDSASGYALPSVVAGGRKPKATDCRSDADRRDAVAVCGRLGIPIHFRDFSAEYLAGVFKHFLAEYAAGRTPNPDVLCNREIKFKHFLDAARELGAQFIATGHYARVERTGEHWRLLRAVDRSKDQSYFLHQLGQAQLSATRFPLGEMLKSDVRRIAGEAGLPTAAKKDSTGICFIGERNFREFLARYLPARTGEIRTPDQRRVGAHPGVFYFTLGQREGLNIGGVRGFEPAPWYVVGKDVGNNVLYVDQGIDNPWLQSRTVWSQAAHWVTGSPPAGRFDCTAQTRYRQTDEACHVVVDGDGRLQVRFARPQRAVTPGQSLVLYNGDECIGGAVITSTDAPLELHLKAHAA